MELLILETAKVTLRLKCLALAFVPSLAQELDYRAALEPKEEFLQEALAHLRQKFLLRVGVDPQAKRKPKAAQRSRQLLDGSTIAVLRTPRLAARYSVASNSTGQSDWCLMRIVVGFCARSGAILSAIEGAVTQSEQALSWKLMEKAAAFTIWIGDRNFGVWSVVAQAVRYQQDVVVRMTNARANKLCKGRPMVSGEDRRVEWSPSRSDQSAAGTAREAVSGRLIYIYFCRNGTWIHLYLFTTLDALEYPIELLLKWYGQRWQAELNFRSVKTQLKMEELHVTTPRMARKEFYAGLIAYSLVRAVLWEAGDRLEEKVKTLSFSQARRVLIDRLQEWGRKSRSGARGAARWVRALLEEVLLHTLPKRKKPRPNEVRRVRRRAQKFPPLRGSRAASRSASMAKLS